MVKKKKIPEDIFEENDIKILKYGNDKFISEQSILKILHKTNMPSNLRVANKHSINKIKKYNIEHFLSYIKHVKNNPFLIDYQKNFGYYDKLKYKKEVLAVYELIKNIPYQGEWQYPINAFGKKYILDYAFPQFRIGIEIDEPHHISKTNKSDDGHRQTSLKTLGWTLIRITVGENIDYNELNLDINYINTILKYLDIDITIDKLKEEFGDFADLDGFCKMFGLSIINSKKTKDPFQISLDNALYALGINKNTDVKKYNTIMEMFSAEVDNDSENSVEIQNSDDSSSDNEDNEDDSGSFDIEESDDSIPDIKTKNLSREDVNKSLQWFEENIDYVKHDDDTILITREAFSRLAINAQTVVGKQISKALDKFVKMIDEFIFKRYESQRQDSIDLHQKMIERELHKRREYEENIEIMKKDKYIQNLEKELLKYNNYTEIQKLKQKK